MKSELGIVSYLRESGRGFIIGASILFASAVAAYGAIELSKLPELWNSFDKRARENYSDFMLKPPAYKVTDITSVKTR